jgi:transcription initiation factor TFIIH subunit 4
MLPHLAKTLVMALLYTHAPTPASDMNMIFKSATETQQAKDRAFSILQRLRILFEEIEAGATVYRLSSAFARSLRQALTGGGKDHRSFGVPSSTPDKSAVSISFLDTFSRQQWEAILYYVVGSAGRDLGGGERQVTISSGTASLLEQGKFVSARGNHRSITQAGFTFLLQEVNAQVWTLLVVYLEVSPALQMDPVDVLSFLFTLGSLELGISYSTSNLSPTQLRLLEDLADFGLVYRRSPDSTRYYPTRLATTLTSDAPALPNNTMVASASAAKSASADPLAASANDRGYIILETNYRLYAYTSSPLPISVLSLFATLHTRYPNLVTGKITKSSVQTAIGMGITSAQIIAYLTVHAHPILRAQANQHGSPILPPTVVDQIRLWQIEGERMTAWKGYLIKDIGTEDDYLKAVAYAEAIGVLRKEFRSKRMLFVTRFEQMGTYFKNLSARKKQELAAREAAAGAAPKS